MVLVGRLVADPELRQTQGGVPVASFRIAVDRQRSRDGGDKQTDFFGVSIWRQRAERAVEFLR
ncbi:MAG: single-stranded DNA-binding protein, partial [Candidatus Eremiobacteraeota bacterium]|nr:single-stranded DNA-binding protein [Candidatus Eremiobacteraeota bacterium]